MERILFSAPPSPNCRSVLMAIKAADIEEIQVKDLNMEAGEHKSDWYLKLNPNGAVPTLIDGGFVLWESRPIMSYIVSKYGKNQSLYPNDPASRAVVDRFLYFDNTTLQPKIHQYVLPIYFAGQASNDEQRKEVNEALKSLDGYLQGKNYLTGAAPTIADFACLASVTMLEHVDFNFSSVRNVRAWLARAKQLPYYEEANRGLSVFSSMMSQ